MPDTASAASPTPATTPTARRRQRGQVLAIFAVATIVFVGILAVVVDVSWYWSSSLKVQRAADAAALAGVVWLPGDVTHGIAAADAEAAKNGFPTGSTATVTPNQDSQITPGGDPRQMDVTISAPVNTFFMRLFGITKITATRTSHAVYVLPVPMGSPQNYYGAFGPIYRTGTQPVPVNDSTGGNTPDQASSSRSGIGDWTNPTRGFTQDGQYATSATSGKDQGYYDFNLGPFPSGTSIDGIQVDIIAKASRTGCQINVSLSNNGGNSFTSTQATGTLTTAGAGAQYTVGGQATLWGKTWNTSQLSGNNNSTFIVRITDAGCTGAASHTTSLDSVEATVYYDYTDTEPVPDGTLTDPYNNSLNPQGFWGTVLSEGAETISGDAYLPYYDTATSSTNPAYSTSFYDYDVSMPAGSSNGEVWIFDPGFCAGDLTHGTGDGWYSGTGAMSTFYTLYDTKLTNDNGDDTVVASSGNLFKQEKASDTTVGGDKPQGSVADCSPGSITSPSNGNYYHLKWWSWPAAWPVARCTASTSRRRIPRLSMTRRTRTLATALRSGPRLRMGPRMCTASGLWRRSSRSQRTSLHSSIWHRSTRSTRGRPWRFGSSTQVIPMPCRPRSRSSPRRRQGMSPPPSPGPQPRERRMRLRPIATA